MDGKICSLASTCFLHFLNFHALTVIERKNEQASNVRLLKLVNISVVIKENLDKNTQPSRRERALSLEDMSVWNEVN